MVLQCGDTMLSHLAQRAIKYDDITSVVNIRPAERRRPNISLKQETYELFIKVTISCISCLKNIKHVVMYCECIIRLVLVLSLICVLTIGSDDQDL
jgi:hypothetical protein